LSASEAFFSTTTLSPLQHFASAVFVAPALQQAFSEQALVLLAVVVLALLEQLDAFDAHSLVDAFALQEEALTALESHSALLVIDAVVTEAFEEHSVLALAVLSQDDFDFSQPGPARTAGTRKARVTAKKSVFIRFISNYLICFLVID